MSEQNVDTHAPVAKKRERGEAPKPERKRRAANCGAGRKPRRSAQATIAVKREALLNVRDLIGGTEVLLFSALKDLSHDIAQHDDMSTARSLLLAVSLLDAVVRAELRDAIAVADPEAKERGAA